MITINVTDDQAKSIVKLQTTAFGNRLQEVQYNLYVTYY